MHDDHSVEQKQTVTRMHVLTVWPRL